MQIKSDPIDERSFFFFTCLALQPRRRALSGRVGRVTRHMDGCWRYSQHRTRCRNLITSDCFFRHSSDTYLYAPEPRKTQPEQIKIESLVRPRNLEIEIALERWRRIGEELSPMDSDVALPSSPSCGQGFGGSEGDARVKCGWL